MHVLFLHTAREWSGTARLFARAARGISERGAKVTLLVTPDSNVHLAVSPRRAPNQPRHTPIPEPFEIIPFSTEGGFFSAARRLKKIFRRWDADAIFVTTDREHLIASTACWLTRGGSVVRWTPAGKKLQMAFAGTFAGWLTKTSYLFASETDRRASDVPKNAIESGSAEIGVDMTTYPTNGAKPASPEGTASENPGEAPVEDPAKGKHGEAFIVCVYDPTSRGRAATAIRTMSMLAPRHPHLRLMIVGPGSDDEDLRMQAAALRVLHLVSFLGERDDQVSLMKDAHLGWVVAEGDTGVYGILDLMALGIPTVASEGGISQRYIAHGINGALYPSDDSATTAAAVAGLLQSEESRVAMGKAGRTRVAREFPETATIEGFDRAANSARTRGRRPG
ncbi:MAG: glycosyltransferase family 4 protein [Gemmatimonadota bacterium]|nr:glycosyltransferase family 4 protein [Gemmatimonadota bacterium]